VRRAEPFLEAAAGAARRLGHGYVGTEHLLLALAAAGEVRGVSTAQVEAEIVAEVGRPAPPPKPLDALRRGFWLTAARDQSTALASPAERAFLADVP
jgi:hypothetical protein